MGALTLAINGGQTGLRRAFTGLALVMLASAMTLTDAAAKKRPRPQQSQPAELVEPLTIVVALRRQRLLVFDANGLVTSSPISSGRARYRTPRGVFTILQKREQHYSNLYEDASMPNMQRLTWSGVALHAGHLPGYPASHGCIRLPDRFSKYLFGVTRLGSRVIVTDEPVTPKPFSHEAMLKPLPPGDAEAEVQTASLVTPPGTNPATDMLLGVNTAMAADSTEAGPRTRASLARALAQQIADLQEILDKHRATEKGINSELKEANLSLRAANLAMKAGELELRKVTQQIASNQLDGTAKADLLRTFMGRHANTEAGGASAETGSAEDALEPLLRDQIAALELPQGESARLSALIIERRHAAANARDLRDAILKRRIAARKASVTASVALEQVRSAAARRNRPVTVLLSRKTSTMYVRQGFEDILEAPIEFADPEAPVGTHLITALDYSADGSDLTWHAVTAITRGPASTPSSKKARKKADQTAATPRQTPASALKRVSIAQHLRDELAEYLKPGSSIIISDEGKSPETSGYTDLIVEF